jgi:hypothetical protein
VRYRTRHDVPALIENDQFEGVTWCACAHDPRSITAKAAVIVTCSLWSVNWRALSGRAWMDDAIFRHCPLA